MLTCNNTASGELLEVPEGLPVKEQFPIPACPLLRFHFLPHCQPLTQNPCKLTIITYQQQRNTEELTPTAICIVVSQATMCLLIKEKPTLISKLMSTGERYPHQPFYWLLSSGVISNDCSCYLLTMGPMGISLMLPWLLSENCPLSL